MELEIRPEPSELERAAIVAALAQVEPPRPAEPPEADGGDEE